MNNWFLFSLAAPLLWAFGNVIDAAARRHFVKSDLAMSWLSSMTRLPLILLLFWLGGFNLPEFSTAIWLMFAGIVWLLPFVFYYKSLSLEETSRVALMLEFLPIFTLGIAFILIGEKLTGSQGWAFFVILTGNIVAAIKHFEGKWNFSKALLLMVLANIGWAISDVLFKKYAAHFDNFFTPFAFYTLGMSLFALAFFIHPKLLRPITKQFKGLSGRAWALLAADQTCGLLGTVAFAYALTLGKASLTAVITGMQPLFVFVFSLLLVRIIPEIPREDVTKSALSFKGLAFTLMMIGLWMLS